MQREHARVEGFSRRAALLGGGQALLFSALVGRLYYLQITEADRYTMLAEDNRISLRLLPPPRGRIVDRHGVPIALNQPNYRAVLVSELTPDLGATLSSLENVLPISERERRRILREIRRKRSFVPVTIKENLDWDDVARIEVNAPSLPGVSIEVGQSRYYPFAEAAGHVLGYVAAVSEEEQGADPLLKLPEFRIGKNGVEKTYDLALRGKAGSSHIEVDALGRVIRELERNEGQSGQELVLTIDSGLQDYIVHRLEGLSASAVVMDTLSGEVLALVSTPGFDPNAFNKGLSEETWRNLVSNSRSPLVNKSISGQYAPGSTFKMMVALAALEGGIITPDQRFLCEGYVELGDSWFHCWKEKGHGSVDMVSALQQSCDVYFYEVARRTGIDRISEMARRFGMGTKLGIDIPSERDGLIPTRDWKLAVIGSSWQLGETLLAGIGQGYVLSTPLQLAVMTARLVNGGVAVEPHVTHDLVEGESALRRPDPAFPDLGISSASLAVVKKGMDAVANTPQGTAFRARINEKGKEMGGKTGTAQVRRISKWERESGVLKNRQRPWEERDHALFVGYAPYQNPRFVVSVVVEHGGGGSKVAAPLGRDILLETQRRIGGEGQTAVAGDEPARRDG